MKRKVSWKILFSWQILYKCIHKWNCSVIETINEKKTLDFKIVQRWSILWCQRIQFKTLFEFYTNVKWMECGFLFTPALAWNAALYSPLFGLRKGSVVAGGPWWAVHTWVIFCLISSWWDSGEYKRDQIKYWSLSPKQTSDANLLWVKTWNL